MACYPVADRTGLQNVAAFGYLACIVATIIAIQVAPSFSEVVPDVTKESSLAGQRVSSVAGAVAADSSPWASHLLRSTASEKEDESAKNPAAPTPSPATVRSVPLASFIPLDFSLPETDPTDMDVASATEGSIKVRKVVQAGPAEIGAVDIIISRNSQLFMSIGDARRLLEINDSAARKLQSFPASGLISFKTMREKGVDFRYDPSRDLILLDLK